MIIKCDIKKLIISLLIPLAVGGLSALIVGNDMDIYKDITRPPLSPPSIVFPIAWTILYILMGISLYLVMCEKGNYDNKTKGYVFFATQLIFNFLWSPIFFSAKLYAIAFIVLILMWISALLMIIYFYKVNKTAGLLQIPYIVWLTFAGYLNLGIYLLNK